MSFDVSSFLGGSLLTQADLPSPVQTWTISKAEQRVVGNEPKICISFQEFPQKSLGLNKTNLRAVAALFGTNTGAWIGQRVQIFRGRTFYQGQALPCVRVAPSGQPLPEPAFDQQGIPQPPQPMPAAAAPAPAPQPAQQMAPPQQMSVAAPVQAPVAAPQAQPPAPQQQAAPAPWEASQQQNSPPSA